MFTTESVPKSEGSLPPREAWIEIKVIFWITMEMEESLPPREAWIEIGYGIKQVTAEYVASPAGSVD